ncbi:MAG: polysaccharide deacetylase family protein, partial [Selenomonadaceae bacterium]|nr:polysaccharide deacetylase family protein [Selenomonadaceae bacterium]
MKKIFLLALIIFGLGVYHSLAQTADEISAIADGPKILVLNYHQIDNKSNPLSVTPANFDTQMKFLVDSGCITITPDELYAG